MPSTAAVVGALVLCTSVAALRLSERQAVREDPKVVSFGRGIESGDVPVLGLDEASTFFQAMTKSAESKNLAASKTLQGTKMTCTPTKLLVLVFGLMRSYQTAWPIVSEQLNIKDMEKCGGFADLIVNTDLMTKCSGKDWERGSCNEAQNALSPEQYIEQIKQTYHPHIKAIFNSTQFDMRRIPESLDGSVASKHFTDETGFLKNMFGGMNQDIDFNQYTHFVAIRPDAHFTQNMPDLHETCKKFSGFNVVHGDYETHCWIHSRDWDKGYLACGASLMKDWFMPQETCKEGEPLPEVPPSFGGQWYTEGVPILGEGSCGFHAEEMTECKALKQFAQHKTRVGTLDEDGIFVHVL